MTVLQRIQARVIKRSHSRVEDGKIVRYLKGDFVLVSERELKLFPYVLARADAPAPFEEGEGSSSLTANNPQGGPPSRGAHQGDDAGGGPSEIEVEMGARRQRVTEAPDLPALRFLADEFGIRVNKSWGIDRTREFMIVELTQIINGA